MAGEEQSKLDFHEILTNLDRKFEIILTKWTDNKDFEIRIRTEIDRDNDDFNSLCDQWVDTFSYVTKTIWVKKISNTGPKIRFRKQYQCWTHGTGKVQKELLFDSRKCKGVLDMKVLTDTPLTRRKNKHIRMGLNAVVKINFSHLHAVDTTQPYSFFVHNCPAQPDPLQPTQILLPPTPILLPVPPPMQHTSQNNKLESPASVTEAAEQFIMFDASLAQTLTLAQPTHLLHTQYITPDGSQDPYL